MSILYKIVNFVLFAKNPNMLSELQSFVFTFTGHKNQEINRSYLFDCKKH